MAYPHCHSCHWSQDDFWDFRFNKYGYFRFKPFNISWGYNPFSCFLSYVFGKGGYIIPRRIKHDEWYAKEQGWKRSDPHSWWLILKQISRLRRKFKNMRWKTLESFKRCPNKVCPQCGANNLDID